MESWPTTYEERLEKVRDLISHETEDVKLQKKALAIVLCEDPNLDPEQQSNYHFKNDHPEWGVQAGDREMSVGLSQIFLPANKDITYEEATSPRFAIQFLITHLEQGHDSMWLTCSQKIAH